MPKSKRKEKSADWCLHHELCPRMHFTSEVTMIDMWKYFTAHQSTWLNCCLQAKDRKQNNYCGLLWIYKPNQVRRTMYFTMLISVFYINIFYVEIEYRIFSWAYRDCWFDRQVNDNTQGICPRNTSGMIHHNNLSATAFKNTSIIHQQSKLSSLLSSTAWVYLGELYRLKNRVWICITRTALWVIQNVIGPVLPLGIHNPTAVPGRPCVSVCVKPAQ